MDVVEFADMAANQRKIVLVAALDGTFDRKNFNRILELIPMAEFVTKLNAVCMSCGDDAAFTKRLARKGYEDLTYHIYFCSKTELSD